MVSADVVLWIVYAAMPLGAGVCVVVVGVDGIVGDVEGDTMVDGPCKAVSADAFNVVEMNKLII